MGWPDSTLWMELKDLGNIPATALPLGYRVRSYRTGDAKVWTDIQRVADTSNVFSDRTFEEQYPASENVRQQRIFFAEDGEGLPVGTSSAWYGKDGERGSWGLVHWVAVLPAHQRRGLGRALLAHTLRVMATMHRGALLCTDTNRPAAVKLYRDFGFKEIPMP